ncbi:MAG: nucleotide kinase domain-containing protein [Actinomycetales bacterium]
MYPLYWYFAAERQRIFLQRIAGSTAPPTADPILQEYKFCNTYRASDRVSQYMIRNVAYHDEPCDAEDRLFQIVAFRTFSRIGTWEGLRRILGHYPTLADLDGDALIDALDQVRASQGGLYTGAFILCATDAYGQTAKHRNHVQLFRHMFLLEGLGVEILKAESLRSIYEALHRYPLMGDFMSYQTAIDLNYSDLVNFDESDFTQPGPGAVRGIKKCFVSLGDYSASEVIQWMVDHQEEEFDRLGLDFPGLFGRPLQAIDCQGLFCETDKYCRAALPDLASNRRRIKARFTPQPSLPELYYPPKWGINETAANAQRTRLLESLF